MAIKMKIDDVDGTIRTQKQKIQTPLEKQRAGGG